MTKLEYWLTRGLSAMKRMYEQLCGLLGRSEDDRRYRKFLSELDDTPRVFGTGLPTIYIHSKSGISFICYEKRVQSVTLHFLTASAKSGEVSPYGGDLPEGISQTDTGAAVARKFGRKPISSEIVSGERWDDYDFEPLLLTSVFSAPSGTLGSIILSLKSSSMSPAL